MILCENTREQAEEQLELWRKQSRIKDSESAGVRQNTYHHLPVMTVKLNLVEKRYKI